MMGDRAILSTVVKSIALIFAALIVSVAIRTLSSGPRTIKAPECKPLDRDFIKADQDMVSRFQQAIRFQTVSLAPHVYNAQALLDIREFIYKAYPTVHSSAYVQHEVVANYSLLYTITGSDPSLKPYLLMGHLDVVPVENPNIWEAPPFEGIIQEGFVYGRGALDDKHTVFGIYEALEFLLKSGHRPRRSFYLAFGHDEEVAGVEGAYAMGQLLKSRGVQVDFVLDEGLTIVEDVVPGLPIPAALIGSSEKGAVTLRISVNCTGGHSSMPLKESCIGILANAVTRLENNRHPSMFGLGPERAMFEHLAPFMNLPFRAVMSNLWLFSPIVNMIMSRKPETNALIRTTTAVTMFNAGVKENVLAPYASAVVNHRIHPAQTVKEVLDYDKYLIDDDRISYEVLWAFDPLPKSPYGDEDFGYQTIKTSILQVWGYKNLVVAPSTMIGNTDTWHYTDLSDNIYRFSPTYMYPHDLKRFHGVNERLSVKNWEEAVNFFYHVMVNADNADLEPRHKHGEEL